MVRDIEKTYSGITYKFHLSDTPFYDGYYNQRWEGSILEVVADGHTHTEPFVLYSARGVKFSKVVKAIEKMREAECVYFVERVFGDAGLDIHNRFAIYHTGRKGLWKAYHKEGMQYKEGMNNEDMTRKYIEQYAKRKQTGMEAELRKEKTKQCYQSDMMEIAKLTDAMLG